MDTQLKELLSELGNAINEALADSERIAEIVERIKTSGYEIFLNLEATIGVTKIDADSVKVSLAAPWGGAPLSGRPAKVPGAACDHDRLH